MINKELLSEVMGVKIQEVSTANEIVSYIKLGDYDEWSHIDIHKLAHASIIWAAKENFRIESRLSHGIEKGKARLVTNQEMGFCVFGYQRQHEYHSDWFEAESIPDAVFAACTWILENKQCSHYKKEKQ